MNKSIDEARKLMCAQKVSERSDNKVLAVKTHAAIRARPKRRERGRGRGRGPGAMAARRGLTVGKAKAA